MNKSNAHDDEPVLTTSDAARLLGISVSTAQAWMETGALPSWKTPGGHRRVRLSTVLQQLEGMAAATSAGADHATQQALETQETLRIEALQRSGLLDDSSNETFDRLTWLACQITAAPISLITLLTPAEQRFKSKQGMTATATPRAWAFCNHTILQDDLFAVSDTLQDSRFSDNPLVTGAPHLRFYAGIALRDRAGFRLGALCVIDTEARLLTTRQSRGLRELAAIANSEIHHLGAPRSDL
jgi:excisionase family DNA binding protein